MACPQRAPIVEQVISRPQRSEDARSRTTASASPPSPGGSLARTVGVASGVRARARVDSEAGAPDPAATQRRNAASTSDSVAMRTVPVGLVGHRTGSTGRKFRLLDVSVGRKGPSGTRISSVIVVTGGERSDG